jgi:hypothetical protein
MVDSIPTKATAAARVKEPRTPFVCNFPEFFIGRSDIRYLELATFRAGQSRKEIDPC